MSNEFNPAKVCARVRILRKFKGIPMQQQMAVLLGANIKQYDHWENGRTVIPVLYAVRLCGLTGANLDYIYRGDISSLPINLINYINQLAE
jgi:transcriptional regulator with XRE-family HTH domain